jgi:arylsulfatase A-like enzyme
MVGPMNASGVVSASALLLLLATAAVAHDADHHPNVVIVLSDDLGYGSVNCYGASQNHIRTPNIDRLAREGRRFTDANTPSSVCSPTRYGLLTGRYCWRTAEKHGVLGTRAPLLVETTRPTIGSMLQSVGYRTAAIGKWHLGYGVGEAHFTKRLQPGPLEIGFDYHFGVPQNHGDAAGIYVRNRSTVGLRSSRIVPSGTSPYGREFFGIDAPHRVDENVMDELTTEAVQWLNDQDADTPFLLYFAPVAIHFPYTPSSQTKGKSGIGAYGDWIHELDLSVGRLMDALDRLGFAEETLLIFTSDNGGVLRTEGDRPEADAYRAGLRVNGRWRGRKHSIYEGGFRVPFIVRWPGKVTAETTSDETISLVDLFATIAAVVGKSLPSDEEGAEDSFNVLPALLGQSLSGPLRPSMIVHSVDGNFAIREGPWKYIEGKASPTAHRVLRPEELGAQLYNLRNDPAEQKNLVDVHPTVANRLANLLDVHRDRGHSR